MLRENATGTKLTAPARRDRKLVAKTGELRNKLTSPLVWQASLMPINMETIFWTASPAQVHHHVRCTCTQQASSCRKHNVKIVPASQSAGHYPVLSRGCPLITGQIQVVYRVHSVAWAPSQTSGNVRMRLAGRATCASFTLRS